MNVNSPLGYSSAVVTRLVAMRREMEDLERQFGSGIKATTYGGLGSERSLAISFRSQIESIKTYQQSIDLLDTRLKTATGTLQHMQDIVTETRSAFDPNKFDLLADGVTVQQKTAKSAMVEFLGLLNSEVAGRYMFGGRQTDKPPVKSFDEIMDGNGGRAGFRQVMEERRQADLGTGNGRLASSIAGADVTLAEDGVHPFGFKLQPATSTLSNATVSAPAGSPPSLTVSFTGQPSPGEVLRLTLTQPDGSTTQVELKAAGANDFDNGLFAIGATPADTAQNLKDALDDRLAYAASTDLTAASAAEASENFFAAFGGVAPKRVAGPPFASATALVDGTPANTVSWYVGDDTPTTGARAEVQSKVDSAVSVSYGMRANEEAFSWHLRQFAVMTAVDLSGGGTTEKALHSSLATKLKANLANPPGTQTLTAVHMEIALAQTAAKSADERHTLNESTLQGYLNDTEGVDKNEVAVKLLSLQTSMQSSYQAASMLYKLSLTNFL
ncbi:flagellar protein [Prosthecomicrobium sp. N25]|uniref:flagellar protein n=1 Tax=Prosthecomicrobium sp. N25 TaxID=3129254 RepID=UPI003078265E